MSEAGQLIARLRRAMPRNTDVMTLCDLAERALIAMSRPPVHVMSPPLVMSQPGATCPVCDARRQAHRLRVRTYRARARRP